MMSTFLEDVVGALFGWVARYEEDLDWALDGDGVAVVEARTDNGAVVLHGADEGQVVVRAHKEVRGPSEAAARDFAEQVQINVEREGDRVRVYKEHPRPPIGYSVCVRYEITCPRGLQAELHTSNGRIAVEDIGGAVDAKTSNGKIEVRGGAERVAARTSNGAIDLVDVSGHVRAETSNGRIKVQVARLEESVFSTSNGKIDLHIGAGVAPVTAHTSNGAIDVWLPVDFVGQLDARTSNGLVRSDLPVTVAEGSRNRLVGQIGSGGDAMVKLRTQNGAIRVAVA